MKAIKFALPILAALISISISSCTSKGEEPVDEAYLASTGIELKVDGKVALTYDPLTWQLAYKPSANEFRVNSDQMSEYYVLTCSQLPQTVDQQVTGTLKWTSGSTVKTKKDISLKVVKADADGKVWLWCPQEKIGVTVKILR